MPIQDGTYEQEDAETILNNLADEADREFEQDQIEPSEGSFNRAIFTGLAETLANRQEAALAELYESAYLQTADGRELTRKASEIGVERRPAIKATGVVKFSRENRATTDYTIPKGTVVETLSDPPVRFLTTEKATIQEISDFDSGSLDQAWKGDTGTFRVQDGTAYSSFALEGDPAADADGNILYRTDIPFRQGSSFSFKHHLNIDGSSEFLFGVQDAQNFYFVRYEDINNVIEIGKVVNGTRTTFDSKSGAPPTNEWFTTTIDWQLDDDITATVTDIDGNELVSVTGTDTTSSDPYLSGGLGFRSNDGNGTKYWDEVGMTAISVNVQAAEGGTQGNVGPYTLEVMPSPPNGVNSVTNPRAIGKTAYYDTNENAYTIGQDREDDESLRDRALETKAIGGAATVNALDAALRGMPEVRGVTLYRNATATDNTGSGGLPPWSTEIVVYGGNVTDVAQQIFDTKAITTRLYGGAHGTEVTETIQSEILASAETIRFSRPPKVDVDLTIDLVHDDSYVGKTEIRERIMDHIGGTGTDGEPVLGTGIGEDIYIDRLEDIIVGTDTGVIGVSNISTTPSTTTDGNGLTVIDVADNEVALTNGEDGSITINETKL